MESPLDPGNEVPCPFCSKAIQVVDVLWTCPCCQTLNREWSFFSSCEMCAFSPYYFECPRCSSAVTIGHPALR